MSDIGPETIVEMPAPQVRERAANGASGLPALAIGAVFFVGGIVVAVLGGTFEDAAKAGVMTAGIVVAVLALFGLCGLTTVAPGEARVLQLFGHYKGTLRTDGLRWVNPLMGATKVSTRIRNHETQTAKVNDNDGNPIEIAAVVVWQVKDTAQAKFEVDDFEEFVAIQTETAVRHIANSYPYDNHGDGGLSLRDNADEITGKLSAEIGARVASAGVSVVESRITRLSYAPEIAQAMLRRQQAGAVVAARQRIVEGAVGMVEMALTRLEEGDMVELDDDRRAAMVSNLLVVLCSEQATAPVINTGSLYS
ncbi:SPFH domain-containing protein [Streptomyces sp. SID3343]|uniref:SPFH domain-containing protein n=1 Tax=Streptomyces sp. SID3343 TaxID=2690260 RepID=UPI00136DE9C9|nr:SPFH domain-containing protein [Streptomyces sp. SID3343]MYW03427.1 SPFH domain-containing protein [Streptomyces sp. SID3343]